MREFQFYSYKLIFKYLFLIGLMAVSMKLTGGAGFAIVSLLAFYSLFKHQPEDLFFYMLLTIASIVMNPNLLPKGAAYAIEQRGTMAFFGFILTLRVAGQAKSPYLVPLIGVVFYVIYMLFPSAVGWCPPISFLKILLFLMVFMAYFSSANEAINSRTPNLLVIRSMVLALAITFIWGSIALIPFPGYGLMRSRFMDAQTGMRALTSFFMGMTSHSQCLGPIISGFAILLLSDWFFNIKKFSKLYLGLVICCPLLVWKTGSRTALMTFVLGVMFIGYFFLQARYVGSKWKGKVITNLWLVAILGATVIMVNPKSRESLKRHLVKHGVSEDDRVEVTMENFTSSRMGLVNTALDNFKESPLYGNGFQVSYLMKGLKINSIGELLSAPIEKGVWVTAILEEGGVIGFVLFVSFLISAILKLVKRRAYVCASVFFVFIVSNMGEFSFFSTSYLGGFMWALVFAAATLDASRAKAEMGRNQLIPPYAMR